MRRVPVVTLSAAAIVLGLAGSLRAMPAKPRMLFDDFSYASQAQLESHGWIVRTAPGWPGVPNATWSKGDVTLVDDPAQSGNRLLRLASSTDGTGAGTRQTQVCHRRKYREGTYATRVRFRDAPASGPDGDQLVETFYAISPLKKPLDLSYSELDFEYLPNGGWGYAPPILFVTSWETFSPEPNWIADNTSTNRVGSKDGWHVLVLQVANGTMTYFVDGVPLANHGSRFYPEVPMSINYNLWFIRDGLAKSREPRRYEEDVDWAFHQAGVVLSPAQVAAKVAQLRRGGLAFRDTVPAARHPLASPCNF
jgi:hypothetical protein